MIISCITCVIREAKWCWLAATFANTFCSFFVTAVYICTVRMLFQIHKTSSSMHLEQYLSVSNALFVGGLFAGLGLLFFIMHRTLHIHKTDLEKFLGVLLKNTGEGWEMNSSRLAKVMLDFPVISMMLGLMIFIKPSYGLFILFFYSIVIYVLWRDLVPSISHLNAQVLRAFLDITTILIFVISVLFIDLFDFQTEVLGMLVCVFGVRLSNALLVPIVQALMRLNAI